LQAIVFDIDGTLADIKHRLHFVTDGDADWESFFKEIPNDKPNEELVDLARHLMMSNYKEVLFATGRPERTREDTVAWLIKNGIDTDFGKSLFMRKDGDRRDDHIIKSEILLAMKNEGYDPVLVFDDRQSVVDMWREHGIRVAQVAPGNF
jgi:phosphoglycolate phosphatase-like HAD superfamily hydrolase